MLPGSVAKKIFDYQQTVTEAMNGRLNEIQGWAQALNQKISSVVGDSQSVFTHFQELFRITHANSLCLREEIEKQDSPDSRCGQEILATKTQVAAIDEGCTRMERELKELSGVVHALRTEMAAVQATSNAPPQALSAQFERIDARIRDVEECAGQLIERMLQLEGSFNAHVATIDQIVERKVLQVLEVHLPSLVQGCMASALQQQLERVKEEIQTQVGISCDPHFEEHQVFQASVQLQFDAAFDRIQKLENLGSSGLVGGGVSTAVASSEEPSGAETPESSAEGTPVLAILPDSAQQLQKKMQLLRQASLGWSGGGTHLRVPLPSQPFCRQLRMPAFLHRFPARCSLTPLRGVSQTHAKT